MAIKGAIFDCDGTLIDSMPMWNRVFRDLVSAHGGQLSDAEFDEGEPLSADEECVWLHERFGIGESAECLIGELRALVRKEYASNTSAMSGVRAFLDELAGAGIPMIIATSTPAEDVRVALTACDLEGYFADVVFAGDVGRSKEFPDVYLAACERIGTDVSSTWVFEDAPFGLATAHEAGFRTVCVMNDHDGRDEAFCRAHSDILVHGYPELSLALLADFAPVPTRTTGTVDVLIVASSPEPSSVTTVARLAVASDYVIAADGGGGICRRAGIVPDAWVGDADSATDGDARWVHANATAIDFPADKYATDLALAVDAARHEAARRGRNLHLTVTCASGGRTDHALGVIGVLARAADASPCLMEDGYECRILSPAGTSTWDFGVDDLGRSFSAIPLAAGTVVSERGLRWELDHFELGMLDDRGISNVVSAGNATVTCHAGTLACFLMHDDLHS